MKKYFLLCAVVFACGAGTSLAQIKINATSVQKKPLLQIPVVHITPVESLFTPARIELVKPFAVSLKPIIFDKQESAACDYFKTLQPTLVLNAERANEITASLEWQTKYAFYATGFNIERSLEDSLHFSTVHTAAASTGSRFKKNYSLPDHNTYSGLSFYRIKQRNGDTGFMYSNIVAVKGVEALAFTVYPNPAPDRVWVDIAPGQSGNFVIMVYDPAGKAVQQQSFSGIEKRHNVQSLNVSKLAAGPYQVKILMADKTFVTGKFIKK